MRDMRVYVQDMMECIEVKDLGRIEACFTVTMLGSKLEART